MQYAGAALALLPLFVPVPSAAQQAETELPDTIVWRADGAAMVRVPAGQFLYGPGEETLSLPAFFVDKHEVTCHRFAQFLNAVGTTQDAEGNPYLATPMYPGYTREPEDRSFTLQLNRLGDAWQAKPEWESRPVIRVSQAGALAYAAWAGKRVPTPLEWEKAARGTDGREYPWGDDPDRSKLVMYGDTHGARGQPPVEPVGSRPAGASPYGALDMFGNVQEWTLYAAGEREAHPYGGWVLMGIEYLVPGPNATGVIGFGNEDRLETCVHAAECGIEGHWPGLRCVVSQIDMRSDQWRPDADG